jgi:hypothetical protein
LRSTTAPLGIDSRRGANVHYHVAFTKSRSGNAAGALESARESVRIFTKLGITDSMWSADSNLLKELEGVVYRVNGQQH